MAKKHKASEERQKFAFPDRKTIRNAVAKQPLIWTVDTQKAREFRQSYYPRCDVLLVQINWDAEGGFYYLPLEVQRKIFRDIGRERYIKLPKPGTNPRGVEITKEALEAIATDKDSKAIEIHWQRTEIAYNPYERWVDHWREE